MYGFLAFVPLIPSFDGATFPVWFFLDSNCPFIPWPPPFRNSMRCPSSSYNGTRLVCCLDGPAFIHPWTLRAREWSEHRISIAQSCLCSLQASTLCDFSSHCPRVGILLVFFEDRKDQLQVKLYTSLSIQPPSELLQVAATFVIRTPTAILPSALLPSSSVPQVFRLLQPIHSHTDLARRSHRQPYQGTHDASAVSNISGTDFQAAYIATKPWLNFFQAHKLLKKK